MSGYFPTRSTKGNRADKLIRMTFFWRAICQGGNLRDGCPLAASRADRSRCELPSLLSPDCHPEDFISTWRNVHLVRLRLRETGLGAEFDQKSRISTPKNVTPLTSSWFLNWPQTWASWWWEYFCSLSVARPKILLPLFVTFVLHTCMTSVW